MTGRKGETINRFRVFVFSWLMLIVGVALDAQQPSTPTPPTPPGLKSGNPTPGTPQPEPPNLADRMTLTGCVERGMEREPASAPSDTRFLLTQAQRKSVVPPDTGTSSGAARPAATKYRLRGIDSQLSPFVGAQVEISGELVSTDSKSDAEILLVEFVQKISSKCS